MKNDLFLIRILEYFNPSMFYLRISAKSAGNILPQIAQINAEGVFRDPLMIFRGFHPVIIEFLFPLFMYLKLSIPGHAVTLLIRTGRFKTENT